MDESDKSIKTALELIKGYAYGNKITRQDIKDVLFLAKKFNGREMFKLLENRKLIVLIEGEPRFPGDNDVYQISKEGFEITNEIIV
ncbi:MAG: hypothetical protein ACR2NW_03235 [Thermodesulfobacteriota bacterium]